MLVSEFNFSIDSKVIGNTIASGNLSNQQIFIAFPIDAMKILLYTPSRDSIPEQKQYLNINKEITSLYSCRINPNLNYDVLIVGTKCSLQCYDIIENKDLFYKDMVDGVSALAFGSVKNGECPIIIGGGNCSILVLN